MSDLPAGYLVIGDTPFHVANVRRYTTDIERFKQYLPLVNELHGLTPGDEGARDICAKADDFEALALTCEESGRLLNAAMLDLMEGRTA